MGRAPTPLTGNRFQVEIDGIAETGFAQVVFPDLAIGEGVADGHLQLRRPASRDRALFEWWEAARGDAHKARRDVRVSLFDAMLEPQLAWLFRGARPVALGYSSLDANVAGLVFETISLAFERLERV
jgi:phage tail-like protein